LGDGGLHVSLSPREIDDVCAAINAEVARLLSAGRLPIVLVSPAVRPAVKQLTSSYIPQLIVLGFGEITRDTRVESVGTATVADPHEPASVSFKRSA
jgi:flagellar biosynthesis protein FlhA